MKPLVRILLLCLLMPCLSCGSSGGGDRDSDTGEDQTREYETSFDSLGEVSDSAADENDSGTAELPEDTSVKADCEANSFSCDGDVLMACENGKWKAWNDCTVTNARCTVVYGEYQCVGATEIRDSENTDSNTASRDSEDAIDTQSDIPDDTSVDSDTSSIADTQSTTDSETATLSGTDSATVSDSDSGAEMQCDGDDVDCYEECWDCALETDTCKPAVDACMADVNCKTYYDCKEAVCCQGTHDCLTGDDWISCLATCRAANNVSGVAVELFDAIDYCVACNVCEQSCSRNLWDEWSRCADPDEINRVDVPCYAEDAEEGQYACFSWAGWGGGPCTQQVNTCKGDPVCVALEWCIAETWDYDDWQQRQDQCFADAGEQVESAYWDYMQCIYCDACDIACLKDAGSKNCDEYDK